MTMQFAFALFILIMHCVNASILYLTLGLNKTYVSDQGTQILTFGSNWEFGSGDTPVVGGVASSPQTKLYVQNTMINKLSYKVQFLTGSQLSKISTTSYFAAVDEDSKLRCYETYNLTEKSVGMNKKITNVKIIENFVIAFKKADSFIAVVNLYQGGSSSSSKNIGGYQVYDACATSTFYILYVVKKGKDSHHLFFYTGTSITSTTLNKTIDLLEPMNPTLTQRIFYQQSTTLLIRISSTYIELYNTTSNILTSNLSISQGTLTSAVLCNKFVVYSVLNVVYFYDVKTLTLKGLISTSTQTVSQLKCFQDDLLVGASYNMNTTSVLGVLGQKKFQVHYYSLQVQQTEETQNTSQPTPDPSPDTIPEQDPENSTNSTNSTDPLPSPDPIQEPIPSPPTPQPEPIKSQPSVSPIISEDVKQGIETSAQIIGAVSLFSFGKNLMKPFLSIMDNFWFYGFHVIEYPDIVQFFTNQIDVLNQLRIKSDFLNFELDVEKFNQQNSLYVRALRIHDREPETVYTFQSLKNVYINNFALSIISFSIMKIITKCMKHCCGYFVNPQNKIAHQIYKYLSSTCYWWCLLVTCIQSNISVLTFFSTIQLNMFSSFEILDMISLMTGLLFLFSTFFYSFFLYIFVFTFNSKSKSNLLLGFGKHSPGGLILQMSINCIFPFLDALAHGIFINRHSIQILSLILLNLMQISLMVRLRKEFNYKIDCVLFVVYKVIFLGFNVNIFLFSFYGDLPIPFNFVFTVMIISLLFITVCKLFSAIGIMIYEKCKNKSKRSKEKDSLQIPNIQNEILQEQNFKITLKNIEVNTISNLKTKQSLFSSKNKIKKQKQNSGSYLFTLKKKSNKITFADKEFDPPSVQNMNPNHKELTSMKLIGQAKKNVKFNDKNLKLSDSNKKNVKFTQNNEELMDENKKSMQQIRSRKAKSDYSSKETVSCSNRPKTMLKTINLAYFGKKSIGN